MNKKKGPTTLFYIIADIVICFAASLVGIMLRFTIEYNAVPANAIQNASVLCAVWIPFHVAIMALFRLYNRLWRYASVREAIRILIACTVSATVAVLIGYCFRFTSFVSYYFFLWMVLTVLTLASRFAIRIYISLKHTYGKHGSESKSIVHVMLVGAGSAGYAIARAVEIDSKLSNTKIVCAIDDDPRKKGRYIFGIKIVGGRNSIIWAAKHYRVDEIFFAISSADTATRNEFFAICHQTGCVVKSIPSYYQLATGKVSITNLREISISDLLDRPEYEIDYSKISEYISDKVVLVTGAGGSIGSELCRQVASFSPAKLLMLDCYENSLFEISNEIQKKWPNLSVETMVGSVRDHARLESIFSELHPQIVLHAAAHKHVPLMEGSPHEAIKNNVFGTLNLVRVSDKYSVERFLMISTDKAVNPTSVMGATKRICEVIIQQYDRISNTEFAAVRFGNVLGSNGSVVPIFQRQIAEGGPVTVTDKDITRYFMTIPEAVSLVLQACAFAEGGEIFVLDMGSPVKILTLAENMIRLSGYEPYKDIDIVFTGLRPGEKLFEELLLDSEGLQVTRHSQIFVTKPLILDADECKKKLQTLYDAAQDESSDVRAAIKNILPNYHPDVF